MGKLGMLQSPAHRGLCAQSICVTDAFHDNLIRRNSFQRHSRRLNTEITLFDLPNNDGFGYIILHDDRRIFQ